MIEWLHSPVGQRLFKATAVIIAWLLFCLFIALLRRRRQQQLALPVGDGAAPLLLCHASQTGFALGIAMQTGRSLQMAGCPVLLKSLGDVDLAALQSAGRVLFVVSTTGEGDPPDTAIAFVRKTMHEQARLDGLQYGLLALGDREYRRFCGFGRELDRWLKHQGAQPLFDAVEVDNADEGALRHWQHHLELLGDGRVMPDWTLPEYQEWTLVERTLLNPGSAGGSTFHLALKAKGQVPSWQAGDIAEIGPRNSAAQVEEALRMLQLPADAVLEDAGRKELWSDYLARSALADDLASLRMLTRQELSKAFSPLPHREYSIASIPADGRLELLLRQTRHPDGTLGIGSAWLSEHAAVGETIALRIRSNPGFHPPADDRPMILVGNGTGLAGLRAQLKQRIAAGRRRNWLLFGERSSLHDFYFREEIQAWRDSGDLARLDLAFSRDQAERIYVQHRLRQSAVELRRWMDEGASIYVCGSLEGMAPAVTAALNDILGIAAVEQLIEDGRYRRDVY